MTRPQKIHYGLWIILILAMVTELALQTFYLNKFGMYNTPIVSILSGIVVALAAFGLGGFKKPELTNFQLTPSKTKYIAMAVLFTAGTIVCGIALKGVFAKYAIDAKISDIIPSLEFYVRRLLAGEVVYRPLPFEGYSVDPTYLPLLWSPYAFSELLGIDYRWTAYLVFLIAIFFSQRKLIQQDIPLPELLVKLAIPFIALFILISSKPLSFGYVYYLAMLLPFGYPFIC